MSIGINKHFWNKWRHLSRDMMSCIIPYLSFLNIWWCGGGGGQPWPCDLQMTAYKKGLLMHDVVQLTCLAANDILLMQKWNHAFFLLGIAHAWKWQIALLPKEILIKKLSDRMCLADQCLADQLFLCPPLKHRDIFRLPSSIISKF